MIAYFKSNDTTVEVPDDIGDGDLADIQKNFSHYSPEVTRERSPEELKQAGVITEYKPNFYESYIKPSLQEFGIVDIPLVANRTPSAQAFVGKTIESVTFGASKPITDVFSPAYKDHPVYSFLGELAGGVGSLLATSGILSETQLPRLAKASGQAGTAITAAAPRFIAPAIMASATFGTNTFINKTVESLQNGGVDIADFGLSVIRDTALGGLLGGISGIANSTTAIASAAGLGFLSSKLEDGDDTENALNAGIWGIFEAVGSFGRDVRFRKQALGNLSETIGEYVKARDPNMTSEQARNVGINIVNREAAKVGGIDTLVEKEVEGALQFIEDLNQKIRNGKIKTKVSAAGTTEQAPSTGGAEKDPERIKRKKIENKPLTPQEEKLIRGERVIGGLQAPEKKELFQTTGELFMDKEQQDKKYTSSKGRGRQFGSSEDLRASIESAVGLNFIQKMKGPELVKLAKMLSGNVPTIKKMMKSLGYFKPSKEKIALSKDIFDNQQLWESVLSHEIGHLMDYHPDKTMKRGNILGRIASFKKYLKSLLPESPSSIETILTDDDRKRFRNEAARMATQRKKTPVDKATPNNLFNPQAILDVWNNVEANTDPELLDFIKRISTEEKKAIIKAAIQAKNKGEEVTINGVRKFNKEASADPNRVETIYRDLIQKEIKKRKLWQEEVISEELKTLSLYWKPFDTNNPGQRAYRFSSPELYADFVSVLLNAPRKAKEIAPNAYKAYFNYLENKPDVMKVLLELQALVQSDDVDLQTVRGEDMLAMYESGEIAFEIRQANLEAAQKSTWDKLRIIHWDKNSILYDERNKLMEKEPLLPAEDAQYAIEKNAMMGNFVKSHLEDFDRLVYKPAKKLNFLSELKQVLYLDRVGADRRELANPLGHTPETAKAFLDNMAKVDPVKFQKVQALAQAARNWFRDLTKIPGGEDFFSPEQRYTMSLNDKYVPFRVVDYMKDYVSAGFSQQMGTFKDIGDPLTSLAMKGASVATAIERNRLKKIVGKMLLKTGIQMRPAKITNFPGTFRIEEPTENYLGTLAWKDQGKWVAYHLDKYIADTFNHAATEKIGIIGGTLNKIFGNQFFRASFITFNMSFQSVNLIRDFMRTWKTTPGLKLAQAFRLYFSSLPEAKARARGIYDPLIQIMERTGALQLTLNDLILGQTTEDRELETLLKKFDIESVESPGKKFKGVPILEQIVQIMDFIRYTGDTIETLPKVVGWKALDYMSDEERAYYVRNLVGTPNPKRAGIGAPVMNSVLLFSNIFKEGFRGLIEAGFTNPKTRKSYWIKTFESSILPKIIMGAIAGGALGLGAKAVMDKASEYHKTNYIVIPLGIDTKGNGIYITLPQDEDARLIGALTWKMLNYNGDLQKNLSDIFSVGAGQFPGVAPGLLIGSAWIEFLSGGNPKDIFRSQDVLTQQEHEAGGKYALEPMGRWTLNETGLVRLDVRDRLKDEPIYKTIISTTPILQRFIRIGQTGEREILQREANKVKTSEAQTSLDIKDMAMEAIKKGQSESDFVGTATTLEQAKDYRTAYKSEKKGFTNDSKVKALNSATSNDQKVAILKKVKEGFPRNKFNDYIDSLYSNKIISARVALEVKY